MPLKVEKINLREALKPDPQDLIPWVRGIGDDIAYESSKKGLRDARVGVSTEGGQIRLSVSGQAPAASVATPAGPLLNAPPGTRFIPFARARPGQVIPKRRDLTGGLIGRRGIEKAIERARGSLRRLLGGTS